LKRYVLKLHRQVTVRSSITKSPKNAGTYWYVRVPQNGLSQPPSEKAHDGETEDVKAYRPQTPFPTTGTPEAMIKDRPGHTSIATTVDRYGHLAPETKGVGRTAAENAMREAVF
jgi:hypothetical protein